MSKELVKRLREYAGFDPEKVLLHSEAADMIEHLTKQRGELLEHLDTVERCSNDPALVAMAKRAVASVKGEKHES